MAAEDIVGLAPGQDGEYSTTHTLPSGRTGASAVLTVYSKEGGAVVLTKTITTVLDAHGQVTTAADVATLRFIFSVANLNLFSYTTPYYVYTLSITDNTGKISWVVPQGRFAVKPKG